MTGTDRYLVDTVVDLFSVKLHCTIALGMPSKGSHNESGLKPQGYLHSRTLSAPKWIRVERRICPPKKK